MLRKIVNIDKDKCNGCGLCISACHEGAIELVDGKAELVSESYCDGLGNCLPECPTGAIQIIEKEAGAFDDEAVRQRMAQKAAAPQPAEEHKMPCGCPGTMAKRINKSHSGNSCSSAPASNAANQSEISQVRSGSELRQWPVQLKLVNPTADYFNGANLLVAADCVAYAYADFHRDFIKDHITVIGCPKLDDNTYYADKLTEILARNDIKSITVVRMIVPCCGGIVNAVKSAMLRSGKIVPYREVTISTEGDIM